MSENSKCEESKYENIIAKLTFEQLVYEASIINKQYKTIKAQKKALQNEFDRRLNENRKGNY